MARLRDWEERLGRPAAALLDMDDLALRNAVFRRESFACLGRETPPNRAYDFRRYLGSAVAAATRVSTVAHSIRLIFDRRGPAEIVFAIVRRIAVPMCCLHPHRRRAVERLANNALDRKRRNNAVLAQVDVPVTSRLDVQAAHFLRNTRFDHLPPPIAGDFRALQRPNPSERRHLVQALIARDFSPFFGRGVCHATS